MPYRIPNIENLQQIEAVVSGPDGANRLIVVTGRLPVGCNAWSSSPQQVVVQKTISALVGPSLSRHQFIRAIAVASVASTILTSTSAGLFELGIIDVDADWDDESNKVELLVELSVKSSGIDNRANLYSIAFQVTILAAI